MSIPSTDSFHLFCSRFDTYEQARKLIKGSLCASFEVLKPACFSDIYASYTPSQQLECHQKIFYLLSNDTIPSNPDRSHFWTTHLTVELDSSIRISWEWLKLLPASDWRYDQTFDSSDYYLKLLAFEPENREDINRISEQHLGTDPESLVNSWKDQGVGYIPITRSREALLLINPRIGTCERYPLVEPTLWESRHRTVYRPVQEMVVKIDLIIKYYLPRATLFCSGDVSPESDLALLLTSLHNSFSLSNWERLLTCIDRITVILQGFQTSQKWRILSKENKFSAFDTLLNISYERTCEISRNSLSTGAKEARNYGEFTTSFATFLTNHLPKKVNLPVSIQLLDIGSGTGQFLVQFGAMLRARKCQGVEIRPHLVVMGNQAIGVAKMQLARFKLDCPEVELFQGDFRSCERTESAVKSANVIVCNSFSFCLDQTDRRSTAGDLDVLISGVTQPCIVITSFPFARRHQPTHVVRRQSESIAMSPGWVSWSGNRQPMDKIYIYYIELTVKDVEG